MPYPAFTFPLMAVFFTFQTWLDLRGLRKELRALNAVAGDGSSLKTQQEAIITRRLKRIGAGSFVCGLSVLVSLNIAGLSKQTAVYGLWVYIILLLIAAFTFAINGAPPAVLRWLVKDSNAGRIAST